MIEEGLEGGVMWLANRCMRTTEGFRQLIIREAGSVRHGTADKAKELCPRMIGDALLVESNGRVCQETLQNCFRLCSGRIEVVAEEMDVSQERPEIFVGYGAFLCSFYDRSDLLAVGDGLLVEIALYAEAVEEVRSIAGGPSTVEERNETS